MCALWGAHFYDFSLHPSFFQLVQLPLPVCSLPAKHAIIQLLAFDEIILVDSVSHRSYVAQRRTPTLYDVDLSTMMRTMLKVEMKRDWSAHQVAYTDIP